MSAASLSGIAWTLALGASLGALLALTMVGRGTPRARRLRRLAVCAMNGLRHVSDEGVVFQPTSRSCGVACLQMLLGDRGVSHGRDIAAQAGAGPTSMLAARQVLERYNLTARGVHLDGLRALRAAISDAASGSAMVVLEAERLMPYRPVLAAVAWLASAVGIDRLPYRHWVVVDSVHDDVVRFRDPLLGVIDARAERFGALWDGHALIVGDAPPGARRLARSHREGPIVQDRARPASAGAPVILQDVSRLYDGKVLAVRQVSLELRRSEVLCLLGPNGAGKTTLLKMITGVMPPTSGRVVLDGVDAWKASDAERAALRRSIGYMPERPFLYDRLTPIEYLRFIGRLLGVTDRAVLDERIRHHLERLRLREVGDNPIRTLSHGMRRKVAFAAALVHEPHLLLLDEPTVGLDPASTRIVKDCLLAVRDAGRTVLMTTHVLDTAERVADRFAVLDGGQLRFVGSLAELRAAAGRDDATLEDLFLRLTEPGPGGSGTDADDEEPSGR